MNPTTRYRRIFPAHYAMISLFPREIISETAGQTPYVYGAMQGEDNSVTGALLFTVQESLPTAAILHYAAFTDSGRDDRSKLMETAEKELSRAGVRYILYREYAKTPGDLLESFDLATENGFIPIADEERVLCYNIDRLMDNGFYSGFRGRSDNIVQLADFSDRRCRVFDNRNDHGLFAVRRSSWDPKFTGFLVEDGWFAGVAGAREEAGVILAGDVVLAGEADTKDNFRLMITWLMMKICLGSEAHEVRLTAAGFERIEQIRALFGEPDREIPVIELVKYL